MQTLFSTLRHRDPGAAVDWPCVTLGFARYFVAEEQGHIAHAQLRRGENLLLIGPDHDDDRYGMHSPLALNGTQQCVVWSVGSYRGEPAAR